MDQQPQPNPHRRRKTDSSGSALPNADKTPIAYSALSFGAITVRMVMIDGSPWWPAKDVCAALGIKDHKQSVYGNIKQEDGLEDDERGVYKIPTPSGAQKMLMVNEPGLYALTMKSRKPQAKAFKRWITHEVLPSIRQNGFYFSPAQSAEEHERAIALFVPGAIRSWKATFPNEFFMEVCRLCGWKYDGKRHRTPRGFAAKIRDVIYERMPIGVLVKLDLLNPTDPVTGRRTWKHHQFIAAGVVDWLKERLRALVAIARSEATWHAFKARVDAVYPKPQGQMILPGILPPPALS